MEIYELALLGTGNMGESIIRSILKRKIFKSQDIIATHYNERRINELKKKLPVEIIKSNIQASQKAKIIMLCVRPQQLKNLLEEISSYISNQKLVISIAVGISIDSIEKILSNKPTIIRVIPSSLAFTQHKIGTSFLIYRKNTEREKIKIAKRMFSTMSNVRKVEEKNIDKYTVLNTCTPAFFSAFINIFSEIAEEIGIDPIESCELGANVCSSVGKIILRKKITPKEIIEKIATPNGVTEEGLKIIDTIEFKNLLKKMMLRSYKKVKSFK